MKKILFFLTLLVSISASAQWTKVAGYWEFKYFGSDSMVYVPGDTMRNASVNSIAIKNGVFYYKASAFWTPISGSGGTPLWGNILPLGGLNSQTDLRDSLRARLRLTDTSGMLLPYARNANVIHISDTSGMLLPYLRVSQFTKSNIGLGNVSNFLQVINAGNMNSQAAGAYLSVPSVGSGITMYFATDSLRWRYNNGTSWLDQVGGGGSSFDSLTTQGGGFHTFGYDITKFYPLSSNPSNYLTSNQSISFSPSGGDVSGGVTGTTVLNPTFTVNGIKGNALPSLSSGYLHWNGTNWVFDTPSGGSGITSLNTDVVATGPGAVAATIQPNAVTYAKIQAASQQALLGATAAGNYSEIVIGSNLSLSGSTLNAANSGNTYYISSSGLSTGNGSTPATAINTARLITLSAGFVGGERILFKSGGRFTGLGTFTIKSGTYVGMYGGTVRPQIRGTIPSTSLTWTQSGTVWSAPITQRVATLFKDSLPQHPAQTAYFTITSKPDNFHITATSATGLTLTGGAEVIGKEFNFRWFWDTVVSYNSGTGAFQIQFGNVSTVNEQFKVFNNHNLISSVGDWAWETNGTVFYKSPGNVNPNTLNVELSVDSQAIRIPNGASDITIENIDFFGQALDGIYGDTASAITIRNCKFKAQFNDGICILGTVHGSIMENNTFDSVSCDGLKLGTTYKSSILRDTMTNIGLQSLPPINRNATTTLNVNDRYPWPFNKELGIAAYVNPNSSNNLIDECSASNLSYTGFFFASNYSIARNSIAHDYCMRQQDGAGFYTYSDSVALFATLGWKPTRDIRFINNLAYNAIGIDEGGAQTRVGAVGIYFDQGTYSGLAEGNTAFNTGQGIFLNGGTKNISVIGNHLYDDSTMVYISDWASQNGGDTTQGIIVNKNEFGDLSPNQIAITVRDNDNDASYSPFLNGGDCSDNHFVFPYDSVIIFRSTAGVGNFFYGIVGAQTQYGLGIGQLDPYWLGSAAFVSNDSSKKLTPLDVNYNVSTRTSQTPLGFHNPIGKLFDPNLGPHGAALYIKGAYAQPSTTVAISNDATGSATGTSSISVPVNVVGILNHALPTLPVSSQYLQYVPGTGWVFNTASGGGGTGGPVTIGDSLKLGSLFAIPFVNPTQTWAQDATGFTYNPTYKGLQINNPTQGVSTNDTSGIWLRDTIASTSTVNRASPAITFEAHGWKTNATASDSTAKMKFQLLPTSGSLNPMEHLILSGKYWATPGNNNTTYQSWDDDAFWGRSSTITGALKLTNAVQISATGSGFGSTSFDLQQSGTNSNITNRQSGILQIQTNAKTGITLSNSGNTMINDIAANDDASHALQIKGTEVTSGIDEYKTNLGSTFTTRTKVDKGYTDSSISANLASGGIYLPVGATGPGSTAVTPDSAIWGRNGNSVWVDGQVSITPSSSVGNSQITLTIPVNSLLTGGHAIWGTGMTSQAATGLGVGAVIFGGTPGSNTVNFTLYQTGGTGAIAVYYHYGYRVQ
jgi:hypothetical protein